MSRRCVGSLFVLVALLGACSQARQRESDAAAGSASPDAAFVNGGDCAEAVEPGLPSDAGCVTSASGGDEVLLVYALLDEDSKPRSWRLRLTSDEHDIDQPLRAGSDFSYPRAVGASDVDGDGDQEWWVKVMDLAGHGAPWARLNLFFVTDDALTPLASGGKPLAINYGGISRFGEGAECKEGRLVLLRAEAQNPRNTRWTVSRRSFELRTTTALPSSATRTHS
ncbi:MAG: hypothetical protein ACR2LG_11320 [Actinomycetota bacterium]